MHEGGQCGSLFLSHHNIVPIPFLCTCVKKILIEQIEEGRGGVCVKPRFSDYFNYKLAMEGPGLLNRGNKDNRSKAILLTCLKKNSETFRQ